MPKSRDITLVPPLAGLDRKTAYQSIPPFTTPDCMNVRNQDTDGRRQRIGSRPGIGKAFTQELGSGNPIRLLSKVSYVSSGSGNWTDSFYTRDALIWAVSPVLATDGLPRLDSTGIGTLYALTDEELAMNRAAFTIDDDEPYWVETEISGVPPSASVTHIYRLFARMSGTPNVNTSGLNVELEINYVSAGNYTADGTLKVNGATSYTFTQTAFTFAEYNTSRWFSVKIDGNDVTVTFATKTLANAQTISAHTGQTRVGLGIECDGTVASNGAESPKVNTFRIRSEQASLGRRTQVVASANGQVYYDADGVMTAVGDADAVAADMPLMAAEQRQKLYIANYSTTDATEVPVVYDPVAGTVSDMAATDGTLPTRCKLICRYRDRLVFAGDIVYPHLWYMSRLGDPLDWDYGQLSAGDTGSAVSASNADAGSIGEEITALVPFSDDYLIFGCSDSIWSLRGDPAYGGQIDALSRNVGIVSGFAHCQTPGGELVFLSKDGIYMLPPGTMQHPIPISRERLPNDLLNVDPANTQVTMAFDVEYRGIHIGLTSIFGGQSTHYWLDWENKGFWPSQWPYVQEPYVLFFVSTPTLRGVLMGGRDGYIRRHDNLYEDDDGTEPDAYCVYGPLRPGGSGFTEGIVKGLTCTLNPSQNGVAWTVQTAETAQGVVVSPTNQITGTFDAPAGHGQSYQQVARVRGGAVAVKIESGDDGLPWSVEEMGLTMMPTGKQRRI